MSFEPYSAEHAIAEVTFVFVCNRQFSDADIEAIRSQRNKIRGDLPAISNSDDPPGIRFAYLRPNGSSIWQISASGNVISVNCTRYTRWARIWERASGYASFIIGACTNIDPIQIEGIALNVEDRFEASPEDNDLNSLLVAGDLIPRSLFQRGDIWTYEQHWPAPSTHGRLGNGLEMASRRVRRFVRTSGEEKQIAIVSVEHAQELWFERALDTDSELGHHTANLNEAMAELHDLNKQLVDQLLTEEMKGKIGLWREA